MSRVSFFVGVLLLSYGMAFGQQVPKQPSAEPLTYWKFDTAVDFKGKPLLEGFRVIGFDLRIPEQGERTALIHVQRGYPESKGQDVVAFEPMGQGFQVQLSLVDLDAAMQASAPDLIPKAQVYNVLMNGVYSLVAQQLEPDAEDKAKGAPSWAGTIQAASR